MPADNTITHEQLAELDFKPWDLENSDEEHCDRWRQRLNALFLQLPLVFWVMRKSKLELIAHLQKAERPEELYAVLSVCEGFRENAKAAEWLLMLIGQAEARMMVALHNVYPDCDTSPDDDDEDDDNEDDDDEDDEEDDEDDDEEGEDEEAA